MVLLYETAMIDLGNFTGVHEAARRLGIHEESVRRLIRIGTIPATKIGGQWYIDREDLAIFANTYDAKTGKRKRML